MKRHNQGFTLVEISISLTVIALIAGGIFASASLLHSMEIKKIGLEAQDLKVAITSFNDRYLEYPGDFTDATNTWGTASGCTTSQSIISTDTCNGNGNDHVGYTSATQFMQAGTEDAEIFHAWRHLHAAGLYPEQMDGAAKSGGTTRFADPGVNIPRSSTKLGAWSFFSVQARYTASSGSCSAHTVSSVTSTTCGFDGDSDVQFVIAIGGNGTSNNAAWNQMTRQRFSNVILFGEEDNDDINSAAVLSPEDAAHIDGKFDDGIATTGTIIGVNDPSETDDEGSCWQMDTIQKAYGYNLSYTPTTSNPGCAMMWREAF